MLKVRLLSAAVLLPVVLGCFIAGPRWLIVLFLMLSLALCVYEMAAMVIPALERRFTQDRSSSSPAQAAPSMWAHRGLPMVAVALGWVMLLFSVGGQASATVGIICLTAYGALVIGEFFGRSIDQAAARAYGVLISVCYAGLPWLVVWQLYEMAPNSRFVLLVMTVTWMGDTGGYFGGRWLGGKLLPGRKLAPQISPKKTWEGAATGLLMSIVGAFALDYVYAHVAGVGPVAQSGVLFACGLFGGICEQLGDLLESLFKRFSGVKDSGTIIPGHGGFLDRVDGILFATPVIWAILYYFEPARI